ncbi:RluA family pseudouridine synthase [Sporosarcina sp. FSL W7-1349]|uniref:RluA family pseudouridine synthase n=1 Tax=Sporosarcina sp. FSL W7-1349 TaxID=2921561 RepID=UPI0030F7B01E
MNKPDFRFRLQFEVEEQNILLREFLHSKGISKRTLTALKYEGGALQVNGTERTVRHPLVSGDRVTVVFPEERPSEGLRPEDGALSVIYEDEALLILDKPANRSTIPSRDHPDGSLANWVAGKFKKEGVPATVHIVTRLDRDTSGLLCIAKNRHIHHLLSEQFKVRGIYRNYLAIAEGHLPSGRFTIEQPIGRKEGSIIEREVREDGKYARTDVELLSHHRVNGEELSFISLVLHTGRTHQIRVHLQWSGHPLAGDDLYGGARKLIERQALHCGVLGFVHPLTGEEMMFRSEIPADMLQLISKDHGVISRKL